MKKEILPHDIVALEALIREQLAELHRLRVDVAGRSITTVHKVKALRRAIARMHTLRHTMMKP